MDEVAMITGGSSGIGAATAQTLAGRGWRVVIADLVPPTAPWARDVVFERLDVTDPSNWSRLVAHVRSTTGRIDALVNAAGTQGDLRVGRLVNCTVENWETVLRVNLTGAFVGCRTILPVMEEQGRGSIVNVSSIAAYYPTAYNVAYGCSKAGLTQLSKTVAIEGASSRIRCNSVHPGITRTPMVDQINGRASDGGLDEDFSRRIPLGRVAEPSEVASVIAFLASAEAEYVTGAEFTVDGGSRLVR